jgi:hypothetical protein
MPESTLSPNPPVGDYEFGNGRENSLRNISEWYRAGKYRIDRVEGNRVTE